MKSALIVGGDAFIGRYLYDYLGRFGVVVYASTRKDNSNLIKLDLSSELVKSNLPRVDVIYLCAAISRFASCEENPEQARLINVTSQIEIAKQAFMMGAKVVFLSSNAVFDGNLKNPSERLITKPNTLYGSLKAEAEMRLTSLSVEYSGALSIVRLTKVLARDLPLILSWTNRIRLNQEIEAFNDVYICPISIQYVVEGLRLIGDSCKNQIFHLSGNQEISYYDLSIKLFEIINPKSNFKIYGTKSNQKYRYNSLSMYHTLDMLGIKPQNIEELLKDLV